MVYIYRCAFEASSTLVNADGAEILLTLLRQPGMSEQQFLADTQWVERDLTALQALLA